MSKEAYVIVSALAVLIHMTGCGNSASEQHSEIRATRFVLVNRLGDEIGELSSDSDGPVFILRDNDGRKRIEMYVDGVDRPFFKMTDETESQRFSVAVTRARGAIVNTDVLYASEDVSVLGVYVAPR